MTCFSSAKSFRISLTMYDSPSTCTRETIACEPSFTRLHSWRLDSISELSCPAPPPTHSTLFTALSPLANFCHSLHDCKTTTPTTHWLFHLLRVEIVCAALPVLHAGTRTTPCNNFQSSQLKGMSEILFHCAGKEFCSHSLEIQKTLRFTQSLFLLDGYTQNTPLAR